LSTIFVPVFSVLGIYIFIFSNGLFTSEQLPSTSISEEKEEELPQENEDIPAFVVSAALLDKHDSS
jgi:hypothetical protein